MLWGCNPTSRADTASVHEALQPLTLQTVAASSSAGHKLIADPSPGDLLDLYRDG